MAVAPWGMCGMQAESWSRGTMRISHASFRMSTCVPATVSGCVIPEHVKDSSQSSRGAGGRQEAARSQCGRRGGSLTEGAPPAQGGMGCA